MPKQPIREPMGYDSMLDMQEKKSSSKIYKEVSDEHKKNELSTLTSQAAKRIIDAVSTEKIELNSYDTGRMERQIELYFKSCEETGTIPSFENLCHALGYTRSAVYKHIGNHPEKPSTILLEITREEIAGIIDNAAMMGNLAPAPAIFVLKSVYERRETVELVAAAQPNILGAPRSPEELEAYIMEKRQGVVLDDYD